MLRIEPVSRSNADLYRHTRLAALKDTPLAFGSTYARESVFTTEQWQERIARVESGEMCSYLAVDDASPDTIAAGLAGAFVHQDDADRAMLISMWVAPSHRRTGVGKLLVDACIAWCRDRQIHTLDLMVTDWNAGAIAFYERLGFHKTGKTVPYPNDARFLEFVMIKSL